ncbi:MAG TPA: iron-containing redox enzyme family protein, partial [Tepidisphaeraceae bacterium]|nr:iron-containing redox enzyme family protein [Tepidisphaeraceae bacterium]
EARAPRVTSCAQEVIRRLGLLENPYLIRLADGSMSLESFRASQEQFFFAVSYFPRPMAALIARLPDPAVRLDVLHNLVEEHGDFQADRFHQNTYREFLRSIGARDPLADGVKPSAVVHAFNTLLMGACAHDEIETSIACLGVIERAFADISATIGKAVVGRGWVPAGRLLHYTLHAEIDVRHADEFFAILEPRWDDPARRAAIEQGLELGAFAFDRLYRDLARS